MPSLPAAALFRASHRAAVASSGVRPAAACVGRVSGGTFHRPVSARACLLSSRAHLSTSAYARESSVVGTPAAVAPPVFKTLLVREVAPDVMEVRLNRPDKSNAMNRDMWAEIQAAFEWLARPDVSARAILLSGEGKNFTSGLDMMDHAPLFLAPKGTETARRAWELHGLIQSYQAAVTALEKCSKPVIALVHGACIGGGVDLIAAADVRLASADARFSIKEVDIGLAADVGSLQRLPKIMGNDSIVRELALTARNFTAEEARAYGLLSSVHVDREALTKHAMDMAKRIASLSPVAVQGTKLNLNAARNLSVADGLAYTAAWNAAMLQSGDIPRAAEAHMAKRTAVFPPLK